MPVPAMPPTGPCPAINPSSAYGSKCLQPVLLKGHIQVLDNQLNCRTVFDSRNEPGGVLRVACKTRRASRCPSCAEVYRKDTFQLIRAGLAGGKDVPETVRDHPRVFVTLTAPSFGTVHTQRTSPTGRALPCHPRRNTGTCEHGKPIPCPIRHGQDDECLGQPLCPDCYDYRAAVLFNAHAPELWRRFTITLRRHLAHLAGLTTGEFAEQVRLSFAKVAEFQRRGVVHFHAVIRLDSPIDPMAPPPAWATVDLLTEAIESAMRTVTVHTPPAEGLPSQVLRWGSQLDIRPIDAFNNREITEQTVAGYIAKYATKAAEATVGHLDRRITGPNDPNLAGISAHAQRIIEVCWHLGSLPELEHLRLRAWAHMLGFKGHFSTKSRRYSTTLGALRAARANHQATETRHRYDLPDPNDDSTLVVTHWRYTGRSPRLVDLITKGGDEDARNQLPHLRQTSRL